MSGYLLLEGGSEFGGAMEAPDRRAIELAGGVDALLCVLPTAAAPDHNHNRAGENARRWFTRLGARRVEVLALIDAASAHDLHIAARLREVKLIYMLGGFPAFLGQTLLGSPAWEAALEAFNGGAVLGGSSAGAMVLCEHYYDPETKHLLPGLGLVPNACVLPHHNQFGRQWAGRLRESLPGALLIGIDERTGLLDEGQEGRWMVYGAGAVTLYDPGGETRVYTSGDGSFHLFEGEGI